ncbi:MAG: xanthine phosphoribosyltransferase [Clostridia bacterium]|nr:xanthine phosphoribosyltransferase [Clostridia bacterium]
MKELEDRILRDGRVLSGNILQVGGFINQQIDTSFTRDLARKVHSLFSSSTVTKVLTIEASGIAFGFAVAEQFGIPLVFAKKSKTSNVDGAVLSAPIHSYTHGSDYTATVSAEYISPDDSVLIVDDFLANGEALRGLIKIVKDAGASVAGAAIEIEKGFQGGGDRLRKEGIRVESLAVIDSMSESGITFRR